MTGHDNDNIAAAAAELTAQDQADAQSAAAAQAAAGQLAAAIGVPAGHEGAGAILRGEQQRQAAPFPVRVDPPRCGCDDCTADRSVPLDRAGWQTVKAMLAGLIPDNTGTALVITAALADQAGWNDQQTWQWRAGTWPADVGDGDPPGGQQPAGTFSLGITLGYPVDDRWDIAGILRDVADEFDDPDRDRGFGEGPAAGNIHPDSEPHGLVIGRWLLIPASLPPAADGGS
jgi:hypothetical protein